MESAQKNSETISCMTLFASLTVSVRPIREGGSYIQLIVAERGGESNALLPAQELGEHACAAERLLGPIGHEDGLHILAGDNEEAKTAFMSAVRDYRQYAPFYCMPSITILIQTAIKYAEENNAEPAATCIGPAVSLLDIFVSSREKMETAYANLPETYKPICDYDIFGRSYVNLSYACWKSGKIDKAIEVANAGLTAMKEVGQENSRPYSMLKYNLEEFRKAPINSK